MKFLNSVKKYWLVISIALLALMVVGYYAYSCYHNEVILELGLFAGSNWDVPNWQSYKIFDNAIERFEKKYPHIKVRYRSGTLKSDYSEWLAQKIIKGKEPDLFVVLSGDFNTFVSIGVLHKLDTLIEKDKDFNITKMYTNAVQSGQFNESQYALPIEVVPVMMFVNKTLLKENNIDIPPKDWTWEEFYDICRKITKDTDGDGVIDQFGVYGFDWHHAIYTNGARIFEDNGKKLLLEEEKISEALRFVKRIYELNKNYKVTSDDFDAGKVAFRPFMLSDYRAYKPYPYRVKKYSQFEWDCIKLPRGPGGKNASKLHSFLVGISARSTHKREAWEFLKLLTFDNYTQYDVLNYSHGVPVIKSITESNDAQEKIFEGTTDAESFIDMKILSEVIEQSVVAPRFKKYNAAIGLVDKEFYRVIYGDYSLDDAIKYLKSELEEYLYD